MGTPGNLIGCAGLLERHRRAHRSHRFIIHRRGHGIRRRRNAATAAGRCIFILFKGHYQFTVRSTHPLIGKGIAAQLNGCCIPRNSIAAVRLGNHHALHMEALVRKPGNRMCLPRLRKYSAIADKAARAAVSFLLRRNHILRLLLKHSAHGYILVIIIFKGIGAGEISLCARIGLTIYGHALDLIA